MSTTCRSCKEHYNGAVFVCRVCGKPIFDSRYDIVVSSAFFNLHDLSYFKVDYHNGWLEDHFFLKKDVGNIAYTDFFREDKYIDQIMEVIYYSFHKYSNYLIVYFKISCYLKNADQLCHSYSSGEGNIMLRQGCNPQTIRNVFQEIRSDMGGDFNVHMTRNNHTFYQFRLIFIQIRPRKRFLNSFESDSESE